MGKSLKQDMEEGRTPPKIKRGVGRPRKIVKSGRVTRWVKVKGKVGSIDGVASLKGGKRIGGHGSVSSVGISSGTVRKWRRKSILSKSSISNGISRALRSRPRVRLSQSGSKPKRLSRISSDSSSAPSPESPTSLTTSSTPTALVKRRVGRPPKTGQLLSRVAASGSESAAYFLRCPLRNGRATVTGKRGVGRPRKNAKQQQVVDADTDPNAASPSTTPGQVLPPDAIPSSSEDNMVPSLSSSSITPILNNDVDIASNILPLEQVDADIASSPCPLDEKGVTLSAPPTISNIPCNISESPSTPQIDNAVSSASTMVTMTKRPVGRPPKVRLNVPSNSSPSIDANAPSGRPVIKIRRRVGRPPKQTQQQQVELSNTDANVVAPPTTPGQIREEILTSGSDAISSPGDVDIQPMNLSMEGAVGDVIPTSCPLNENGVTLSNLSDPSNNISEIPSKPQIDNEVPSANPMVTITKRSVGRPPKNRPNRPSSSSTYIGAKVASGLPVIKHRVGRPPKQAPQQQVVLSNPDANAIAPSTTTTTTGQIREEILTSDAISSPGDNLAYVNSDVDIEPMNLALEQSDINAIPSPCPLNENGVTSNTLSASPLISDVSSNNTSEIPTTSQVNIDAPSANPMTAILRRPVGRPPKNRSRITANLPSGRPVIKRRVGRPPKQAQKEQVVFSDTDANVAASQIIEENLPSNADHSQSDGNITSSSPAPKRRAGRPRKRLTPQEPKTNNDVIPSNGSFIVEIDSSMISTMSTPTSPMDSNSPASSTPTVTKRRIRTKHFPPTALETDTDTDADITRSSSRPFRNSILPSDASASNVDCTISASSTTATVAKRRGPGRPSRKQFATQEVQTDLTIPPFYPNPFNEEFLAFMKSNAIAMSEIDTNQSSSSLPTVIDILPTPIVTETAPDVTPCPTVTDTTPSPTLIDISVSPEKLADVTSSETVTDAGPSPSTSTKGKSLRDRSKIRRHRSDKNSDDEYESNRTPQQIDELKRILKETLENAGLEIKKMTGDGACLFRSVADQICGDQGQHKVVRRNCMDFMTANKPHFSNLLVGTETFEKYIARKRMSATFGNGIELQALSMLYQRNICVYSGSNPNGAVFTYDGDNPKRTIYLAYHQRKVPHFDSVVNRDQSLEETEYESVEVPVLPTIPIPSST